MTTRRTTRGGSPSNVAKQDHASELVRSDELVLVTGEGRPVGLFLPWDAPELPDGARREVFAHLTDQITVEREARGVTEGEVMADFTSSRRA